jgi:glycosyltransferase involved in cell wall biosynthesis
MSERPANPARGPHRDDLRVLIVAEHASARFGGEAILPLQYFRRLRARGIDAWLIVHERTRAELSELLANDLDRIHFVPDTRWHRLLDRWTSRLPQRLQNFTTGWLLRLLSQVMARRIARRLVRELDIRVVHQPIPVSPKEPSLLHSMGAPVVIGPMNGGMTFPPGLGGNRSDDTPFRRFARRLSGVMNLLLPGKRRAAVLVVANERTRRALPPSGKVHVITLAENGVDLSLWTPAQSSEPRATTRFVFLGRLEDWKGVDLLIEAFDGLPAPQATLEIIGDGPMRAPWEGAVNRLGLQSRIRFLGWKSQSQCADELKWADALVLPSFYECGGAVVLEAMACALPVIALAWGGPADYLDDTCGILVPPGPREQMIEDLRAAMSRLAESAQLRRELGRAGRLRVVEHFDWERKIDQILDIYRLATDRADVSISFPATHRESAPLQSSPEQHQ